MNAGDKGAEYAVQSKQSGAERRADRRFEDLVIGVVSGVKRGYVFISDRVCMFSDFSYIRPERAGDVSTGSYRLPHNR